MKRFLSLVLSLAMILPIMLAATPALAEENPYAEHLTFKVFTIDGSDDMFNWPLVKQAMENPYEKALKKYVVGNRYVGTVSMVDLNGVFVSLDGGIDCLCTYPKRGRPPRGARATVRILGINHENNRIWGVITHMSTTR